MHHTSTANVHAMMAVSTTRSDQVGAERRFMAGPWCERCNHARAAVSAIISKTGAVQIQSIKRIRASAIRTSSGDGEPVDEVFQGNGVAGGAGCTPLERI